MHTQIDVGPAQRAIAIRGGRPWRWLEPGRHHLLHPFRTVDIVYYGIDSGYTAMTPELRCLLPDEAGRELEVPANHVAALRIDGRPLAVVEAGRYVLWQLRAPVTAELHSLEPLESTLGRDFWGMVPSGQIAVHSVLNGFQGVLYVDGAVQRVLEPGRHPINVARRVVSLWPVDVREVEVQIVGQEVMTADKVTIRVNLALKYRVTDVIASVSQVGTVRDALYLEAQLIARRHIGAMTIDALLEGRGQLGAAMAEELARRASAWGCKVVELDLKDVVLPGEMKVILNRVIEAEKQAAANLILRREETAATRSMANTAKVLEANPMLLRLKEMEALKEMADRVGNITVVAGGDLMSRLTLPLRAE